MYNFIKLTIVFYLGTMLIIGKESSYYAKEIVRGRPFRNLVSIVGKKRAWIIVNIIWNLFVIFWPISLLFGGIVISKNKKK